LLFLVDLLVIDLVIISSLTICNNITPHSIKISRSATWLISRKHLNEACFYSARPREIRRVFQDQPYSVRGLVGI
jgi:hypothetical protein